MQQLGADDLERLFDFPTLVSALADAFRADLSVPLRHHHTLNMAGEPDATLLLMPAWQTGAFVGTKIVSIFPGNAGRNLPAVMGTYYLASGRTGEPLALIDGTRLTLWRTAAGSALAAGYLARSDSERLLMVGTGRLAPYLVRAHASVRPLREVRIWGRDASRARALAASLVSAEFACTGTTDLEGAVAWADTISCATLSSQPLVHGRWLQPGQHLDLVGAFTPAMRESDDEAVRRSSIYVDTRSGALHEAGDIVQPLQDGVIAECDIRGDLFDLCRGKVGGRDDEHQITLFKSAGTAVEDLAAATLAYRLAVRQS